MTTEKVVRRPQPLLIVQGDWWTKWHCIWTEKKVFNVWHCLGFLQLLKLIIVSLDLGLGWSRYSLSRLHDMVEHWSLRSHDFPRIAWNWRSTNAMLKLHSSNINLKSRSRRKTANHEGFRSWKHPPGMDRRNRICHSSFRRVHVGWVVLPRWIEVNNHIICD